MPPILPALDTPTVKAKRAVWTVTKPARASLISLFLKRNFFRPPWLQEPTTGHGVKEYKEVLEQKLSGEPEPAPYITTLFPSSPIPGPSEPSSGNKPKRAYKFDE
jgi:hypothetical protein